MASLTTGGVTTTGTINTNDGTTLFETAASRSITLGATSVNQALTSTCRYVSLIAAGGTHCHFQIGVGAQTASASSHYIVTGERLFLAVPFDANIAAIRGTGAATTLYITELTQ